MITAVLKINKTSIPELTRIEYEASQASVFQSSDRTLESVESSIREWENNPGKFIVVARDETSHEVIGWMGLYAGFPGMVFIEPWRPFVLPGNNEFAVAGALIEEAKSFVEKTGRVRLEVLFSELTETNRPHYEEYIKLFVSHDLKFSAEEILMTCDLKSISLPESVPPTDIDIVGLHEVVNDEIEKAFFESFRNSQDGLFLDMCEDNQKVAFKYWFMRDRPFVDDASLIAMRDGTVVGFCIVRPEEGHVSMGPVGVISKFRGIGLGKALVVQSMRACKENGHHLVNLEVNVENTAALSLYEKFGFSRQHRSIYHAWKV
jgi:ribosomal protein S18 acetylase RimI-like enzyme